jgi:putative SOS response-associated peptidase YedK
MCGRYTYKSTWAEIVSLYRLTLPEEPPEKLLMAGWGLVPFRLEKEDLARHPCSTIDARSDRIQTAPTCREPFRKRRCIVPTTGWYEWQKTAAKTGRLSISGPRPRPSLSPASTMSSGPGSTSRGGQGHTMAALEFAATDLAS